MGGAAVEIASGLIASRQAERQYDFDIKIARAVDNILANSSGLQSADILNSDEFMASYERAARLAAESASQEQRERLAWAAAQMGDWSTVPQAIRQQLFHMLGEIQDIHARTLAFLDDPQSFIAKTQPNWQTEAGPFVPTTVPQLIKQWIFDNEPGSADLTDIVIDYLESHRLANVPTQMMSTEGAYSTHTTRLGRDLLHLISFPQS
ncbi:hypothetical protein [Leifsonia poae]|uniref:hypothetical protein n=1 Tax=Leifsonia poae TaxID=110933 RepID=UPI003D675932